MTYTETASAMRRLADVIDKAVAKLGKDTDTGRLLPVLEGEVAIGAAFMLVYLRDLITASNRDTFDIPSLLVILETISRDAELLPCGIGVVMWQAEDEFDAGAA